MCHVASLTFQHYDWKCPALFTISHIFWKGMTTNIERNLVYRDWNVVQCTSNAMCIQEPSALVDQFCPIPRVCFIEKFDWPEPNLLSPCTTKLWRGYIVLFPSFYMYITLSILYYVPLIHSEEHEVAALSVYFFVTDYLSGT